MDVNRENLDTIVWEESLLRSSLTSFTPGRKFLAEELLWPTVTV